MNVHYPRVAQRAGYRCEYCRAPEIIFNFPFEVEHVLPISCQGSDDDSNLALACRACNVNKSNHLVGPDASGLNLVPLFHPRRDRWEEHFQLDVETGVIEGRTPVGRATVSRLRMNAATQLGLFP